MGKHRSYQEKKYEVGQRLLMLRTRARLTQVELAALMGVNRRSIQNWETGATYPNEGHLQRLIAVFLNRGALMPGQEQVEAEALWDQVSQDAPHPLVLLDSTWLDALLRDHLASQPGPVENRKATEPAAPSQMIDWGEAINVPMLYGREAEQSTLLQWVIADRCRVVLLLGLGGIGKTSLAITFANQMADQFEVVLFRSLRNAPPLGPLLDSMIGAVSGQQAVPLERVPDKIAQLVQLLRERRCLLVLDNLEAIIQAGDDAGEYRPGYADYGILIQHLGEAVHQSCLMLTSREKPLELGPLEGRTTPVRTLTLAGLTESAGQRILQEKDVVGGEEAYATLIRLYGGNPLALKLVSEPIREIFGGDLAAFLASGDAFFNGVGKLLEQQFSRSSGMEQAVLYWLAIERELVSLDDLLADLTSTGLKREVLQALEALRRRLLVERAAGRPAFTLQPVIMEYITDRLVNQVSGEIAAGQPVLLCSHALVQATAKDYVRQSQERLIASPVLERITFSNDSPGHAKDQLRKLLDLWRNQSTAVQGYGPGNVINLLRLLFGDLRAQDFSGLSIRQAYLQEIEAQDVRLNGAHLEQSVLAEPFEYSTCVALSPDGAFLASSTQGGEVRLWRVSDRTPILSVQAHTGGAYGVAISADGRLLVSSAIDGTAKVWAVPGGQLVTTLQGHTGGVYCVAFSADQRLIASGGADGTVRLWEVSSGTCIAVLQGHSGAVWDVSLAHNRPLLASSSIDGTIRLWSMPDGQPVATLEGHQGPVWGIAFQADGQVLASGGADGTVRLWEVDSGECRTVLQGHTGGVQGVVLAADGQLLASGGMDRTVRLWAVESGTLVAVLQGHAAGVWDVALSSDGRLLASGSFDGTIRLWEPESRTSRAVLQGHSGTVRTVAISTDGQMIASGTSGGIIRVWDIEQAVCRLRLHGHVGMVFSVALSTDRQTLVSSGHDEMVRLWDIVSGKMIARLEGHVDAATGVAFSADGRLLASGGRDGTIRLWDPQSGVSYAIMQAERAGLRDMSLLADGHLLVSGSFDGVIRLWDVQKREALLTLPGHTGLIWRVAISADGRRMASAGEDGIVRVWDTDSGECLAILSGHHGAVYGVVLSADGQLAISGGHDGTLRWWDTQSKTSLRVVQRRGVVWNIALSEDGRLAVSGEHDGAVGVWDVSSGALIRELRPDRPYERMDISRLTGITRAQKAALIALGAVEDEQ